MSSLRLKDVVTLPAVIAGSSCEGCGKELAWRAGVGRMVITHANGEDRCFTPPVATLGAEDVERANGVLHAMDELVRVAKQEEANGS